MSVCKKYNIYKCIYYISRRQFLLPKYRHLVLKSKISWELWTNKTKCLYLGIFRVFWQKMPKYRQLVLGVSFSITYKILLICSQFGNTQWPHPITPTSKPSKPSKTPVSPTTVIFTPNKKDRRSPRNVSTWKWYLMQVICICWKRISSQKIQWKWSSRIVLLFYHERNARW